MAGLIQNVVDTTPKITDTNGVKTGQASASGYTPSEVTINPATQSVSGQLKALLGQGSPYLDQARGNAMVQANSRGLINSSMAAGAGESAAINAALPIATSDAATYNTAALTNAQAENQASQFGANAGNAASSQNAQAVTQVGQQQLQGQQAVEQIGAQGTQQRQTLAQSGEQSLQQIGAQGTEQRSTLAQGGAQDVALQSLKGTQSTQLANIEATYKELMQTSASAATTFAQESQNINAILSDPNTSADQKQAAVDKQTSLLQSTMAVLGGIGGIDLGALLNFA